MTTEHPTTAQPKKQNCFLWGCLIVLVMICLVVGCLGTLVALPLFTDFDPLGLGDQIDEIIPWQEFLDDPSSIPDLPKLFSDENDLTYGDEDSFPDESSPEPPIDLAPDSGSFPLVPYIADDFPFYFSYPAGWEIEVDENSVGVTFYDPDSYTYLSVGSDWLCQGCSTAADASVELMETLEFQAQEGTFVVIEDRTYTVSTGDDAHFNAYEWMDLDGFNAWAYDINITVGEDNHFFFMVGDDSLYFETYGELIEAIGASYSR